MSSNNMMTDEFTFSSSSSSSATAATNRNNNDVVQEVEHKSKEEESTRPTATITNTTNVSANVTTTTTTTITITTLSLMEKYNHVVTALEEIETQLRMIYHPTLIERALPLEVDDIKDHQKILEKNQKQQKSVLVVDDSKIEEEKDSKIEEETKEDSKIEEETKEKEKEVIDIIATISDDMKEASIRRLKLKGSVQINQQMMMIMSSSTIPPISTTKIITIPPPQFKFKFKFDLLLTFDVSNNEITDLPGLKIMKNLQILNINRNWFNELPNEISYLTNLTTIIASRNFLKPNINSLHLIDIKKKLNKLTLLDLQYNQKCGRIFHRERIEEILCCCPPPQLPLPLQIKLKIKIKPKIKILMTLWEEIGDVPGTYVGVSAAVRSPILLRSQLEPLGTVALRRRLVCDFNQLPTDPLHVDRSNVMKLLLKEYYNEKLAYNIQPLAITSTSTINDTDTDTDDDIIDYDSLIANRKILYLEGTPVPQIKIDEILIELRKWTTQTGLINKNRERPSIKADNYMILRKPTKNDNDNNGYKKSNKSRREIRKAKKQERYKHIWDIAINALQDVDPIYANERCTEIAVTYGFKGSPHRDKQNCGPFYGLSMGNFNSGGGGIMVESSARTCVNINTHNKLGKIDGRYVHWVDEWDNTNMNTDDTNDTTGNANNNNNNNNNAGPAGPTTVERYSLIYYETGNNFIKPGPAVFSIPKDIKR